MSSTTEETPLTSRIYASLLERARAETDVPATEDSGWDDPAWKVLLETDPTGIDLEDLLEYMDASDLLLFSDELELAPCREYVAAYLTSRPREQRPALALGPFRQSTLDRAVTCWNRDPGPGEQAITRFFQVLENDIGRSLPMGYPDLLRIALHLDLPLIGLLPEDREGRGMDRVEAAYSKLRVQAHRRAIVGLLPTALLRPDHVQRHLLHAQTLETRVVYQSPPSLHWNWHERGLDVSTTCHLLGSWAFATMATHPIFHAAAIIATRTDDVLLPPCPAHSPRRADAPMVELLLGAAELLKDSVFPNLRAPETAQILTFLDQDLEAKLSVKGLPKRELEPILDRIAHGECVALPERNLVVIGAPLLGPAVEALYRVLVDGHTRPGGNGPYGLVTSTVSWALAFFGSSLVAGRRDWPESEDCDFDPVFEHLLERMEQAIETGEPLEEIAFQIDRSADDLEDLSRRLGRFLGARLVLSRNGRGHLDHAARLLQQVYDGESPIENLQELGELALRD